MKLARILAIATALGLAGVARSAEAMLGESALPSPAAETTPARASRETASVVLTALEHVYDGTAKRVAVTTTPANLPVSITFNGSAFAPVNAGRYEVVATVTSPHYVGQSTATLVIAKAVAPLALSSLWQSYDGAPKAVRITTQPAGLAVDVTYEGGDALPIFPGTYLVEAEIIDPNYTGTAAEALVITPTAAVRHAPSLWGGIDGSLQVLRPENVTLHDRAWISGDLLLPGLPSVRVLGRPTYAGTQDGSGIPLPNDFNATLETNALLRHVLRRIDPIAVPIVNAPPAPAGSRDVVIENEAQVIGEFATLRDLTLRASDRTLSLLPGTYGQLTIEQNSRVVLGTVGVALPVVYNFQKLTLAGGAELRVEGPVVIIVANAVVLNGTAGSLAHPEWLSIKVSAGGLTVGGGSGLLNGNALVPRGTITIEDNAVLNGTIVANRLVVAGNGLLKDPSR